MSSQVLDALGHLVVIRKEDDAAALRAPVLGDEDVRRHGSQQGAQQWLLIVDLTIVDLEGKSARSVLIHGAVHSVWRALIAPR